MRLKNYVFRVREGRIRIGIFWVFKLLLWCGVVADRGI